MNRQEFCSLVKNPNKIRVADLGVLNKMTSAFPYFQSGHILSAKGHFLHKSPSAKQKVSTAALYVTNTKWFKHLLLSAPQGTGRVVRAATSSSRIRPLPEPKASYDYQAGLMSEGERDKLIQEVYQRLDDLKVAKRLYHQRSSELEERYGGGSNNDSDESISGSDRSDTDDEDDPAHVADSLSEETPNQNIDDSEAEAPEVADSTPSSAANLPPDDSQESDTEESDSPPSSTEETPTANLEDSEKQDTEADTFMPISKSERPIGFTIDADAQSLNDSKREKNQEGDGEKQENEQKQQLAIIQNFLDKLPRLDAVKPPNEIILPENTEESVAEIPKSIYSEALAKACEAQKKYRRAIQIYEALKANQPERADFFNQKIQSLEQKCGDE